MANTGANVHKAEPDVTIYINRAKLDPIFINKAKLAANIRKAKTSRKY